LSALFVIFFLLAGFRTGTPERCSPTPELEKKK
jgi:hypothetical protein